MGEFFGKRLALLGTENGADEIANYCKDEGITLISFGNKPAAKIHQVSDEQCIVDCTDSKIMVPLLREKKIDGVFLCTCEKVIKKCSRFLCECGYNFYTTTEQWDILMNKFVFKEYAKKFGISTAPTYTLNEDNEIDKKEKVVFPVVVKPADSCGSVGISVCNNPEEVKAAVEKAKNNSQSRNVVCERYLPDDGQFFQFEVWIRNEEVFFPYVKQRLFYDSIEEHPKQPFIDIAPADSEVVISKYYYDQVTALFKYIGVKNGHCWFQGIIDNDVPFIFDTGFRLGGGKDYKVTKKEKGIDLIECYARFFLTGQFGINLDGLKKPFKYKYAVISLGLKNGFIDKIFGVDEIKAKECVFDFYQYYYEGQMMTRSGIYAHTIFRIFIQADNMKELKHNISNILNIIKVQNKMGESLLLDYPNEYKKWIHS